MSLYESKTEIPFASVDVVDEALLELGVEGWSLLQDVIIKQAWLVGIFESADEAAARWVELKPILAALAVTPADPTPRALPDQDWKDSYKAHFKASQFGPLHWVPVWERETYALPAGDVVIWLDPGLAFGTGNHETTRLCCERLVALAAESGAKKASLKVLDAGCGSGILALSGAKLGFTQVAGFDNDPEAVRVSGENAALNELTGKVDFFVGDLVSGFERFPQSDIVLANIQADVLMRFSDGLLAAVAPGGSLVLSGILAIERDTVRDHFANKATGWAVESRLMGEWSDVRLRRL